MNGFIALKPAKQISIRCLRANSWSSEKERFGARISVRTVRTEISAYLQTRTDSGDRSPLFHCPPGGIPSCAPSNAFVNRHSQPRI